MDFVITDHINVYYSGNEKIDKMINMYKDYVMGETLAESITKKELSSKEYDLNGELCRVEVEVIK